MIKWRVIEKYDVIDDDKLDEIEGSELQKTKNLCNICCSMIMLKFIMTLNTIDFYRLILKHLF